MYSIAVKRHNLANKIEPRRYKFTPLANRFEVTAKNLVNRPTRE